MCERYMYDSMQEEFYVPHMPNDVYKTVRDYWECVQNQLSEIDHAPYNYFWQSAYLNLLQWTSCHSFQKC